MSEQATDLGLRSVATSTKDELALGRLEESLRVSFALPPEAVSWLVEVYSSIQFLDDVYDCANVDRERIIEAAWNLAAAIPGSPFYLRYAHALHPLMEVAVLKWFGANASEEQGVRDARSFCWRAGYYDLVLQSVRIVHGPMAAAKAAVHVMRLYGESFEEYRREPAGA